jgi:hypothetical protein
VNVTDPDPAADERQPPLSTVALADAQYWNEQHMDDVTAHRSGPFLREPQALLSDAPVLLGTDMRKMSKSRNERDRARRRRR